MPVPSLQIEEYLRALKQKLEAADTKDKFFRAIVDAPFEDKYSSTVLGLGFLAFLLVNKRTNILDRITISHTFTALGAINMTNVAFNDMKVPLSHKGNIVLTAIKTKRYQQTNDWHYLTDPAVSAEESRMNQAAAGISSSFVYPVLDAYLEGAIIFQYYVRMHEIGSIQHDFMFRYAKLVSAGINRHKSELKSFLK